MALKFYHDVDDAIVEYLKNRIPKWESVIQQEDGSPRIRMSLNDTEFLPAFFKHSNVHERTKLVEEILSEESEVYTPIILVEPLQPEIMDNTVLYPDPDPIYDEAAQTVTLRKGKRRVSFNYQIEGVTKRWSDFQILQSYFNYRLFPRDGVQDYVELFGQTYTVTRSTPQQVIESEANLFRYIYTAGIEMNLYTLPDEVIESVEDIIFNLSQA